MNAGDARLECIILRICSVRPVGGPLLCGWKKIKIRTRAVAFFNCEVGKLDSIATTARTDGGKVKVDTQLSRTRSEETDRHSVSQCVFSWGRAVAGGECEVIC